MATHSFNAEGTRSSVVQCICTLQLLLSPVVRCANFYSSFLFHARQHTFWPHADVFFQSVICAAHEHTVFTSDSVSSYSNEEKGAPYLGN